MNLDKIRKLSEQYPGGMRQLAADIGMSEPNLHRCVNNNKMQAGDLEKVAQCLNVRIGVFFGEEPNESGTNRFDYARLKEKISLLEQIVAEKERTIRILMKE